MPLWSDDFDRADGPLGDNWAVKSGAPAISGNKVVGGSNAKAMAGPVSGPGAATVEAVVDVAAYGTPTSYLVLKANADWSDGFVVSARTYGGNLYLVVGALTSGGQSDITEYAVLGFSPSTITLRAAYSGGVMSLYYDGNYLAQYTNSTKAANSGIGLYVQSTTLGIYSFTASGDGSPQLIISPRVIGTDDGDQLVSLLGVAVTWTPGVPGSPSFTVNAGALSSQQISSTTNATVVFSPPGTAQTVTLDDPANGISSTIQIVEGTFLGGGQGGPAGLSSGIIDWLTQQAAHGGNVLSDIDALTGAPSPDKIKKTLGDFYLWLASMLGVVPESQPDVPLLPDIYARIWGGEEWTQTSFAPPGTHAIKTDINTLLATLAALTNTYTDLQTLADNLGGTPTIYSNADIMTALGNITGGDNTEVLEAIATLSGALTAQGGDLSAAIAAVRGAGEPSIADIQTAINNLAVAEGAPTALALVAVIAAIALAIPTGGTSLAVPVLAAGGGTVGILATLYEVASLIGTVSGIVSDIAEIKSNLSPAPTSGPPVWPGAANRTLGTSEALGAGGTITETMDGVIVAISDADQDHRYAYSYDGQRAWRNIGALAFADDQGHCEMWQPLTFESALYTPKSMAHASAVHWFTSHGPQGTIQAWTVTV